MEKVKLYRGNIEQEIELDDLKKEFAQILQVENLSFLIGSGCSSNYDEKTKVEKAIPVMSVLAERFFTKYPDFKVQDTELKNHFSTNLEKMLDYMISIRSANYVKVIDNNIDKKIKKVQEFIRSQIMDGMKSNEVLNTYKNFYLKIIRKNRKNSINIFTTNYDLYNEMALDDLGFFYNNGFIGTVVRKFNPVSYNYAFVENMNLHKDIWDRVSNFFNLFKIHGSINWVNSKMNIIEKPIESIGNEEKIMIYPTPLKDRTTLMTPYSDLMRNMQYALMKNNSILITMGYSFSDDHINRIILNTLSIPSFRLVILGNSDNINKIIKLGDSRIWVINSEDKIHYFSNIVEKLLPKIQDDVKERMDIVEKVKSVEAFLKGVEFNDK